MALLSMLLVTALATVFMRDLFAIVMLFGIFSLLTASFFLNLDAPDVAMTEAAIGAGIAPILMLGTLALVRKTSEPKTKKSLPATLLPIVVVGLTGAALIYATLDMPYLADPLAAAHNHVAPRYIEESLQEIGIPNMVTSVLASYRGYDTLGEVFVIFTACIGVLALLGFTHGQSGRQFSQFADTSSLRYHTILHVISKILIPMILLYAFYVQFHGDYSPGGGFQAGVIFAAAFILYAMIYGLKTAQQVVSMLTLNVVMATGALLYAGTGVATLIMGGNFLDYDFLSADPVAGQHLGIILIELGVALCVASAMMSIFFTFAGRAAVPPQDENEGG